MLKGGYIVSERTDLYWQAVFLMVGMIIGAGIFGVPYVFARSGILLGCIVLAVVSAAVLATHLMYAEIVRVGGGKHRLIGDAERILGKQARLPVTVLVICDNIGTLVIYVILGGLFFQNLFGAFLGTSHFVYQLLFFLLGVLLLRRGTSMVDRYNELLTVAFLALLAGLIILAFTGASLPNFTGVYLHDGLEPYGVILFSLIGISAVPEMYALLGKRNGRAYEKAIRVGTIAAAVVVLLFGVAVAGLNGPYTSADAVSGIAAYFGPWVLIPCAIIGLLAVFTSFIVIALNAANTFKLDFKLTETQSQVYTMLPVLILFLTGARDFISVVSFVGTILSGGVVILVCWLYLTLLKSPAGRTFRFTSVVPKTVIAMCLLGIIVQLTR